jgi:hypothetical protein
MPALTSTSGHRRMQRADGHGKEDRMSGRQFGFLVGFLIVWVIGLAGWWVAVGAVLVGIVGYLVARYLEGDLDLEDLGARLQSRAPRRSTIGHRF